MRDDTLFVAEEGRNRVRGIDLASGIITRTAGQGINGNGGDGGPAPLARLSRPQDILVTDDTIYIADFDNHKIRVVDRTSGRIYTYAGNGQIGFSPDGTHMESDTGYMSFPASLEIDDRYLYVSEAGNHRIRRIDRKTKIISTVAGGGRVFDSDGIQATLARLSRPYGTIMKDSIIFFAERDVGRIRRVDLRNGFISTVAGNGQNGDGGDGDAAIRAKLHLPLDIAFYGDSLFISDEANNKIRLVDMKSGIISTFAGDGTPNFRGDGGPPWSASLNSPSGIAVHGDVLYVSDRLNNRIRAISLYLPDGLDSSSSAFSVSAPEMQINSLVVNRNIDLGQVGLGGLKDSIVNALICNSGNAPLLLDSAVTLGRDASDFRVVGGITSDPIPPGGCRTITIEFAPTEIGIRNAFVVVYGACTQPDTLVLQGEGTPKCGAEAIEFVDFGSSRFGDPADDRVIISSLCNNGSSTLAGEVQLISTDGAFTLINGGGAFSLDPGECLDLTVRYDPTTSGRSMGIINYGIPITCGQTQTLLSAQRLRPAELATVNVDLGSTPCPEGSVDTSLRLTNQGETSLEITNITFSLNNEGFSLINTPPTPVSPLIVPAGETITLPVRFAPSSAGVKQGTLQIESNDPNSPTQIDLNGRRDSLRLSSTSPLISVRRDPGATYPRDTVVEIENTGDQAMSVLDGTLNGDDPGFFVLPSNQFPVDIPAGGTATVLVQIVQPTEDRAYRAELDLQFSPACNLPDIVVNLLHSGSTPLLTALPLTFPPLLCDNPSFKDTTITLRNDGGTRLIISSIAVINDPENNFSHSGTTPITLEPGSSTTISVRFNPQSPGVKTGTLQLTANTEDGIEEIPLQGEKGQVSFTLSETSLTFTPGASSPNIESVTLTNTGTSPITWSIPSTIGSYSLVSITPPVTPVNGSSELRIQYDGPASGSPTERLQITETLCATSRELELIASDREGELALWLPHDSAIFNTTVSLPLRYRLENGTLPDDQDTFTTTIRFVGTTFFFEGISDGEIIDRVWTPENNQMAITIRGNFGDRRGDTLTSLIGTGLLANQVETPLTFTSFSWNTPAITFKTEDGSFKVLGTCRDVGLHLISRIPELDRIRPNPASEHLTAEFFLSDWAWLEASLITPRGERIEVLSPANVEAGWHELEIDISELPTGAYLLRLTTPHGVAEEQFLIVQ